MLVDKTDRQTEREGGRREDGKYYTCMKMVAFVLSHSQSSWIMHAVTKRQGGRGGGGLNEGRM